MPPPPTHTHHRHTHITTIGVVPSTTVLRGTTVEQHSPLAYRYIISITAIDTFVAGLHIFRPQSDDRSSLLKYLLENTPRSTTLGCGPEFSPALFGLTTSVNTGAAANTTAATAAATATTASTSSTTTSTSASSTNAASGSAPSGPTMYLLQQVCLDASLVVMRSRDNSTGGTGGHSLHPTLSSSSSSSNINSSNNSNTGRSGSGSGASNGGNNNTLRRTDSSAQDLSERGQGSGNGGMVGGEERVRGGHVSVGRGSMGSRVFADDPALLVRSVTRKTHTIYFLSPPSTINQ